MFRKFVSTKQELGSYFVIKSLFSISFTCGVITAVTYCVAVLVFDRTMLNGWEALPQGIVSNSQVYEQLGCICVFEIL